MRFERGVDPEAVPTGADRACRLMAEWCGATVLRGALEVGGAPPRRRIELRASRTSALIGYPVSTPDATRVFDRLGIHTEPVDEDRLLVEVPGYRVDIEREVDLIEEVVRVQGYEHVGSTLPPVRQAGGVPSAYAFVDRVRDALERAGLREVRQVPFASKADLARTGDADAVRVLNPLQADDGWLRTGLTVGLLKALRRNAFRHLRSIALFEVGSVFRLDNGEVRERAKAAFAMTGAAEPGWTGSAREFDVFDARGVIEATLAELGVPWSVGSSHGAPLHPGRSAIVLVAGDPAGVVGELHPEVAAAFDLSGRVALGELELDVLERNASNAVRINDVPRFPPVRRDLAFTLPAAAPAGAVRDAIAEASGSLLDGLLLFDVFEGPPLPDGTKSLAFSLDFRALDRTLTDEEADAAVAAIAARIRDGFRGELRSG